MLDCHILRGDTSVRTSPCAVIISGIKECGKTTAVARILGSAYTETDDGSNYAKLCHIQSFRPIQGGQRKTLVPLQG